MRKEIKLMCLIKKSLLLSVFLYTSGLLAIAQAEEPIAMCVRYPSGRFLYVMGKNFKKKECRTHHPGAPRYEVKIVLPPQGPKGEKGDPGEQGLPGVEGPMGPAGESGAIAFPCLKQVKIDEIQVQGCNLRLNAIGVPEKGNLLMGPDATATGTHSIVNNDNIASGDGTICAGTGNICKGGATLSGGIFNEVDGIGTTTFGKGNIASGEASFIAGEFGSAEGPASSISGGFGNTTTGNAEAATVVGGSANTATGFAEIVP